MRRAYLKGSGVEEINKRCEPKIRYELCFSNLSMCRVAEIAEKRQISMAQVSLAWILSKKGALTSHSSTVSISF